MLLVTWYIVCCVHIHLCIKYISVHIYFLLSSSLYSKGWIVHFPNFRWQFRPRKLSLATLWANSVWSSLHVCIQYGWQDARAPKVARWCSRRSQTKRLQEVINTIRSQTVELGRLRLVLVEGKSKKLRPQTLVWSGVDGRIKTKEYCSQPWYVLKRMVDRTRIIRYTRRNSTLVSSESILPSPK